MPLVKINWSPSPKHLRQFGAVFGIGFLIIGLAKYFWLWDRLIERDEKSGLIIIIVGITVGALGLTGTKLALPFYWLWMGIAFVLGNVMSRVMMALIYFGVFTPLGLVARVSGRDKLQLKRRENVNSYWHDISLPTDPEKYKRQF